jgi:3-methyladenine DNA glycosylase AlkD
MKYFLYDSAIEEKIQNIKKAILLSMNGISADKMQDAGLAYKQNFGVALPRIKEIAALYTPNARLALRLWQLNIRETMIMGTLLYPRSAFSKELAGEWMSEIQTTELCEQLSLNLLQHVDFAPQEISRWIHAPSIHAQICAYLTASRVAEKLSAEEEEAIIHQIIESPRTDNFAFHHAQSVCLRYFCRKNETLAHHIQAKISIFEYSSHKLKRYVFEEVMQEINFYYDSSF